MSTLVRLCASSLQPSRNSRGNEEMDVQDFSCVTTRLARLDVYACYDFLRGGPRGQQQMAILVSRARERLGDSSVDPGNANMDLRVTAATLRVTVNFSSGSNDRR